MLFITHYAQFLTLPHTKTDKTTRKTLIKHITTSCQNNEDFIKREYQEQHERVLRNAKSPKRLQIAVSESCQKKKFQFDPYLIINTHCDTFNKQEATKLSTLLNYGPKNDDIQRFCFPTKTEPLIGGEKDASCYIHVCLAPPGSQLIVIYDPLTKSFWKKVITISPKQSNREFLLT